VRSVGDPFFRPRVGGRVKLWITETLQGRIDNLNIPCADNLRRTSHEYRNAHVTKSASRAESRIGYRKAGDN